MKKENAKRKMQNAKLQDETAELRPSDSPARCSRMQKEGQVEREKNRCSYANRQSGFSGAGWHAITNHDVYVTASRRVAFFWPNGPLGDEEGKVKNAKCKMQNAECRMQNAECKIVGRNSGAAPIPFCCIGQSVGSRGSIPLRPGHGVPPVGSFFAR
ncbi:MAG: hypothetical protein V1800_00580 [Candidatus Latescibacterota bacterium]